MSDNEEEQVDLEEEEDDQYMDSDQSDQSDQENQEPQTHSATATTNLEIPDQNNNNPDEEMEKLPEDEMEDEETERTNNKRKFPEDEDERRKWEELTVLPPHGAEVFVGGMPRDVNEDELRELFDPFGEIFEVRLVKDKETRENKGFAFIIFTTKDAAQTAIEQVHEKEFKGRTLRCSVSQVKHRLFVGNVPKGLTEEELRKIFEETGPGVQNVEFFKDQQDASRNRGFLFVEYRNHACAEFSRQKLTDPGFEVDGSHLTISWADPKSSLDSAASQVKTLYLKNLPEQVDKDKLKDLFEKHGEVTKVVLPPGKPGQKRDFGFVHYAERSSALKAVKESERYEIDGQVLEVSMAKPQTDRNSHKGGNSRNAPPFGYSEPYGAYGGGGGGGRGSGGYSQPMIYGRGPMPSGMRMVPMVLPDGRLGYVLQQPDGPSEYEGGRGRGRGRRGRDGGGRGGGRRYNPY